MIQLVGKSQLGRLGIEYTKIPSNEAMSPTK